MRANALFSTPVPLALVNHITRLCGLTDVEDTKRFTKYDLRRLDASQKFTPISAMLGLYYIPCKHLRFCHEFMSEANIITVLRQCLRPLGKFLHIKERTWNMQKVMTYQIRDVLNPHQPDRMKRQTESRIISWN